MAEELKAALCWGSGSARMGEEGGGEWVKRKGQLRPKPDSTSALQRSLLALLPSLLRPA